MGGWGLNGIGPQRLPASEGRLRAQIRQRQKEQDDRAAALRQMIAAGSTAWENLSDDEREQARRAKSRVCEHCGYMLLDRINHCSKCFRASK